MIVVSALLPQQHPTPHLAAPGANRQTRRPAVHSAFAFYARCYISASLSRECRSCP